MNGLKLHGISRSFGDHKVLQDVDFGVRRGEIVGFIGGNGAGKTTTMRLILGMLNPSGGYITWDGEPISTENRRSIGYMPEERGLYPQMSVKDQIVHFALLEGKTRGQAKEKADELIATLGLSGREKTLIQDLSLGNQQRVQLAVSLVGNPELLVLDEPFSGLDPLAVDTMAGLIQQQAAQGVGILFSSHQLELVERLCDRVCVLDRGRVMADGAVSELQDTDQTRWELKFDRPAGEFVAELSLVASFHIEFKMSNQSSVFITVDGRDATVPQDVLEIAARFGGLRSIEPVQRSLVALLSQDYISSGRGITPAREAELESAGQTR